MMFVPLSGFAPDLDPTTPGVIVAASNVIPTLKGMKAGYSAVSAGAAALAAACKGAAALRKLDETNRLFAGTATAIYELNSTTWTNRTRAVGGAYTLATANRWRYAQYGNVSLAAAKSDTLQSSTSGAFADIAGAPKFDSIITVNDFVIGFNYNNGTDTVDGWFCSALGDYTNWTPSVSTQCANGRLVSQPGPIVGAKRFGDNAIAYKKRAMYLGVYQGGGNPWAWQEISGEVGALNHEAIMPIVTEQGGSIHLFMGDGDFYAYSGGQPQSIGAPVREFVFANLNRGATYLCEAIHDQTKGIVYFYYPSAASTIADKCVVFNYRTNKWGTDDRTIETTVQFIDTGDTYSSFMTAYTTYSAIPSQTYQEMLAVSDITIVTVLDSTHTMYTLTGTSGTSSVTTGDFGNDDDFVLLKRVRPRFLSSPTSGTMINYYRNSPGDTLTTDATTTLSSGKFDVLRSSRWHRVKMTFSGDMELTGLSYDAGGASNE